jgi:peptidoglycan/LPS O-acetylase OafA/YrhL
MGLIRLLLAISVVLFHSGIPSSYNIANSTVAVLSFFIISGFYMAFILDKKYKGPKAYFLFLSNRFLRIFPLYWIAFLVTLGFVLLKLLFHFGTEDNAIIHYLKYSPSSLSLKFYLDLANVIIRNITLIINLDYFRLNNSQPGYLLIPQAWTLQLELLFYLIAPFIVKLSKKIFLILLSIYLIGFFGYIVPNHIMQPNLAFIFLNNFQFFLLGVLSYKFLYGFFSTKRIQPLVLNVIFLTFLSYLIFYNLIPIKIPLLALNMDNLPYYILLAIALPAIFIQTKSNTIDNFIGKLSYPVYIMHLIIVKLLFNLGLESTSVLKSVLVLFITLYISYLAVRFVDRPIDNFRQNRIKA